MFYLTNLLKWLNPFFYAKEFKEEDSHSKQSNSNSGNEEKLIIGNHSEELQPDISETNKARPENEPQFSGSELKEVLSDFEKLNFKDNECFNNIADDYKKKGKSSLFNYVILNKRKEIINILDEKLPDLKEQEEFRKKYGQYILQIDKGISYGKELQDRLRFFEDRAEEVLSDFEKLRFDFEGNKCENPSDLVNYNNGQPADPLDKIANYYRREKDIFLFNYVVLSKKKEITDILDKMLTSKDQEQLKENFKKRWGRYLLRINEGMNDAEEFLRRKGGLIGFFDGRHWSGEDAEVNHYDNLNINIIKPRQSLETSHLFINKIERMERNKNEVKRVKIYSNGERIVTIEKNEKQQRNYSFTESAICNIEISWTAKDESGKDLNCAIVLNINSGQISIKKSAIDGKDVELKDILKLAKQNEAVLIGGKALHEVLEERLIQKAPCEEKKGHEGIVIPPDTGAPSSAVDGLKVDQPCKEEEQGLGGRTPGVFGS